MTQKIYIVEERQFRTKEDYDRAIHDKEIIEKLRKLSENYSLDQLKQLERALQSGKYRFYTMLGQDYLDELAETIEKREQEAEDTGRGKKKQSASKSQPKKATEKVPRKKESQKRESQKKETQKKAVKKQKAKTTKTKASKAKASTKSKKLSSNKKLNKKVTTEIPEEILRQEIQRQEKQRKRMIFFCSLMAIACLGYLFVYSYQDYRTISTYDKLNELKEKPVLQTENSTESTVKVTLDGEKEAPEVLDEYKNLLNKNKKLIGWVKIADTYIDYPVMQTTDNEYYLDHNLNQEYDKNGSIFMDKDCDVIKPSTNYILYGHHMKSGRMFGSLQKYESESYYKKHSYIEFDTIYEKGTYQIMYAFRSRVYSEEEIVFKYYQFIDANSELEFNSYMQEMAALSYYDTGVTAEYGDQLLTLSTCDYQETDGRFVVVAKKIK